ncbi:hypothetical protein SanaruYs_15990 [Chryseotalea sanaruensis]|uniref:Carboxypeptidase-like regulatory domain-containing protein n=1 Tax=Chryseotalea sanaruensis TaxID=2482724 RepID=A0A401U928_9BACT|nr:carboxypeptidase-like regulatory domain-containing protein [Chryseotalea sanaruensis]GCC51374.1 hypothetical protein SanaruYs_15990 [Chryseotalea sanaruensis]
MLSCNFKLLGRQVSIFILLSLLSSTVFAQAYTSKTSYTILGIVKSSSDSTGISTAHIFIPNKVIGTVTNSAGEFELKIPSDISPVELSFSAIGYKLNTILVNTDTIITIFLDESIYQLNEIIITGNKFDSASYIFDTAIDRIKFNYPRKPHLMEGFYREISMKDTIVGRLIEAAVLVQESGYTKEFFKGKALEETKNRIKVVELRKSDDFMEYDLMGKIYKLLLGEKNELYMTLRKNYVRAFDTNVEQYMLSYENLKKYDMHYIGQGFWGNEIVYILSLSIPQVFRVEKIRFYINKTDFAFVKIEKTGVPGKNWEGSGVNLIEGKYFDKAEVTYRKITNRYFPTFIQSIQSAYGASSTATLEDKEVKQFTNSVLLLINIYEDDFSKIKWKEVESQNEDLYTKDTPYNESFWNNFNTVKNNPLKRVPNELEKEKSLEDQFKRKKN